MRTAGSIAILFFLLSITSLFAQQKMYWTDGRTGILRANLDGSEKEVVLESEFIGVTDLSIDPIQNKFYWIDKDRFNIVRSNLDGSNIEVVYNLAEGSHTNLNLAPETGKMYWTDTQKREMYVGNLDGSSFQLFLEFDNPSLPLRFVRMDFINSKIYFFDRSKLQRMSFDGTELENVTQPNFFETDILFSFEVDPLNGKAYWVESSVLTWDNLVIQVDLNTGSKSTFFFSPNNQFAFAEIAVDPIRNKVYYEDGPNSSMFEIDVNNSINPYTQHVLQNSISNNMLVNPMTGHVWWRNNDHLVNFIKTVNGNSFSTEEITYAHEPTIASPEGIAFDKINQKLYWVDKRIGKIQRSNIDGTEIEDLITSRFNFPRALAIDVEGDKMYWTDRELNGVFRANLDGTNREFLVEGFHTEGLALDLKEGKMYYTVQGAVGIWKANLDGSNPELVFRVGQIIDQLALDLENRKIYFSNANGLQRVDMNGENLEYLNSTSFNVDSGIALDLFQEKVYWLIDQKLLRLNLGGSNPEELRTDLTYPLTYGGYLTLGATHAYKNNCKNLDERFASLNFASYPACSTTEGRIELSLDHQAAYTYQWSTGDTTATLTDLPAGNYKVTISDTACCYITREFVITEDCSALGCAIDQTINDIAMTFGTYSVLGSITSRGTVVAGATVSFRANESIILKPGFHAQQGANFSASLEPGSCNFSPNVTPETVPLEQNSTFTMYPNPTRQHLTIHYKLPQETEIQITLRDLNGRTLKILLPKQKQWSGHYNQEFALPDLPAGIYNIFIQTDKSTNVEQLVILNN